VGFLQRTQGIQRGKANATPIKRQRQDDQQNGEGRGKGAKATKK
jgi:hypothetical protein